MREKILKLVRNEVRSFHQRGGDDLVADWGKSKSAFGENVIELRDRATGRKHEVFITEHEGMYALKVADYGVSEVLGIRCAPQEGTILDSDGYDFTFDSGSTDAQRKFARRLGRLLDEGKGRFEPRREEGVALAKQARYILLSLEPVIPQDGSIWLSCNNDPADDAREDFVSFIGPDAEPLDLYLRMDDSLATLVDANGLVGVFRGTEIQYQLKDIVEERIAAFQTTARP